jgi:translation elongation factor EF-Tu-like GTPase
MVRPVAATILRNGLTLAGVCAGALAVACGGGDDDSATDSRLVLLGHPEHVDAARPLVAGLHATFDDEPDADDALVIVVSAADGPMPATREVIEAIAGTETGALAILLTATEQNEDAELQALVLMETIDLMRRNDLPADDSTPVLRDTDPNLQLTLKGLTVP